MAFCHADGMRRPPAFRRRRKPAEAAAGNPFPAVPDVD